MALTTRAVTGCCLGRPGWRDDLQDGLAMARTADPTSYAIVVTYAYLPQLSFGVLRSTESVMREIAAALEQAERSGDDLALGLVQVTLAVALVHRPTAVERDRGQELLAEVGEGFLRQGQLLAELPLIDVFLARERARCGERHDTISLMRAAADHLFREGRLVAWGIPATGVLVETLLDGGTAGDVAEAEAALERMAVMPADDGLVMRDIWLLRSRALLARARGDAATYAQFRDRYRDKAKVLDFEGHIAWAKAMP
jgi:hypothetical protein